MRGRIESALVLLGSLVALIILLRPDQQFLIDCKTAVRKFPTGWIHVAAITGLLAGLMIFVCWATGAWQGHKAVGILDKNSIHWIAVKFPTVLIQQFALQLILVPALIIIFPKAQYAIIAGAMLFAGIHFPNLLLMIVTFVAAWFWIVAYRRFRQLTPIVVSHFILAVLAAGFCGEYVLNMRVGPACLELIPKSISIEDRKSIILFPRSVIGCVEKLSQTGNQLELDGWVVDAIHAQPPQNMHLLIGNRLVELLDIELSKVNTTNWEYSHKTDQVCCFRFRARIPVNNFAGGEDVQVLATNTNGWYSKIGQMGPIRPHSFSPTAQTTMIFPTEIDGRIHNIVMQGKNTRLVGWIANLKEKDISSELIVRSGTKFHSIDLASVRVRRPDIVRSFGESKYEMCGFNVQAAELGFGQAEEIEFYAIDAEHNFHPIPVTPNALAKMVRQISGNRAVRLR